MCGICGIAGTMVKADRERLVQQMNEAIRHRGPDATGFLSTDFCTLAMTRLSIIDRVGGQQPIYNLARTRCVFFNGEIYNFRELKSRLVEKGYRFATSSDTEVLVHLYDEYGEAMPSHLRGMFAFCIYDIERRALFFARDPFGEKPLFYHFDGANFSFSSEIRSLLQNSRIPRVVSEPALYAYLRVSLVPEPATLLDNVYSLEPGHSLMFADNRIRIQRYFEVDYQPDKALRSEDDILEYLRPILRTAVTRQTVSDVPLGAFLSGGIDSSTIAAFLQAHSDRQLKTFTVRFEDATYDESPIAREVAARLGTDHHEITIPNADFTEEIFWTILDHVGFPFVDSSAIPTYFITREIRKHVTVALSGDGGDELFAGYPVFQWWQKIARLQRYPAPFRHAALRLARLLGAAPGSVGADTLRRATRALTVSNYPEEQFGAALHAMFDEEELDSLLAASHRRELASTLSFGLPPRSSGWSSLRKGMYYRLRYNLPLDMLVKVDRMSMANSLEVRAPFLDRDLFEASARLPDSVLINRGHGKSIIRRLMRDELPRSVFEHPKSGFSIPLHHYQNAEFARLADELIDPASSLGRYFDPIELEALKRSGLANKADNARVSVYKSSHRLWQLMMLFGWARRFDVALPEDLAAARH